MNSSALLGASQSLAVQMLFEGCHKLPGTAALGEQLPSVQSEYGTDHQLKLVFVGPAHDEQIVDLRAEVLQVAVPKLVDVVVGDISPGSTLINPGSDHWEQFGRLWEGLVQASTNDRQVVLAGRDGNGVLAKSRSYDYYLIFMNDSMTQVLGTDKREKSNGR